ncbi:MAG: hypothetical protein ACYTFG_19380 [Planctomycetota bacterium]
MKYIVTKIVSEIYEIDEPYIKGSSDALEEAQRRDRVRSSPERETTAWKVEEVEAE